MKSFLLAAASVLLISGSAVAQSVDGTSAFVAGYAQALNDIKESTGNSSTPVVSAPQHPYPSCVRYQDQCIKDGLTLISDLCDTLSAACSRELKENLINITVPARASN
jgi:hypothetical protein